MQLGVTFPQTEIGADPVALRDYAQAAEDLGFAHLIVYDHVIGADAQKHEGWAGGYTSKDMFHEPFVLFGYLAALTQRLELVTAVLILGQRQTALVAKQAAEVDVLSGGRIRLGIGVGWNHVEYEALGEDFHTRGRRSEEQVELLRALWTQEVIDFKGHWHRVTHAGINPLPVQRPIPIWIGAGGRTHQVPPEVSLRRIGRIADGWFPPVPSGTTRGERSSPGCMATPERRGAIPRPWGMEGRINMADGPAEFWATRAKEWGRAGRDPLLHEHHEGGAKVPPRAYRRHPPVQRGSGWRLADPERARLYHPMA